MSLIRKRGFRGILLNIVLISGFIAAQTNDSSGIKYRIIGMGSLESGQVVGGEANGTDIHVNKAWCQRTYAHLGFQATIGAHTDLFIVGESMVHYAWAQSKANYDEDKPQFLFYPYHVEGSYSFGTGERPFLTAGFGVFPFKYNPDVRNLGEYLFRTGTYPPTMSNQFDFPLARLTGFRLSSTPIDSLNLHAMLTMESDVLPLKDYGISLLGDYTLWKSLTIGAGVFLSHLLSVNEDATTPKNNNLAPIDSANSDTIYYTFRGTKFMGRLAFDPKPFLPWRFFGLNDLRLYSEVALIGFKNFPLYYKDRNRRIPIMVGFNVPTFKTMDVLAVELEWYNWNYPNSYTQYVFNSQVPKPDDVEGYDYKQNRLKWSCYGKKQFGRTFSLIGQIAFDHTRLESNTFTQGLSYFGDAMHKHGDWAWMLKTQFDF
jgi:hypothetical protein